MKVYTYPTSITLPDFRYGMPIIDLTLLVALPSPTYIQQTNIPVFLIKIYMPNLAP